jgi:large subunit ribosomal protein L21
MYAIIETGGKQYKVSEDDKIFVERLDAKEGDSVVFDKVLAMSEDGKTIFGKPYVKGAEVTGKAVKNGKGKKVTVFKFKAKKGYKKTQGHRQPYTCVEITGLKGKSVKKTADKADAE